MKSRTPNVVTLYLEKENIDFTDGKFDFDGGKITFKEEKDAVKVFVSSKKEGIRFIRLRWNQKSRDNVKILGDAWERGYGNLEWESIRPERCMPWYIAVSNGSDAVMDYKGRLTECYGVGVRPNAFAFWQYDGAGVTLWLDVRNGTKPTCLKDRELEVATVFIKDYKDTSAFSAVKDFCHVMSPDPYLCDHVVYGSNNWYYAYGKSSYEEIISDTKLLKKMTENCKEKPYMVVDDCWEVNSLDAPWIPNDKFKDMKKLADEIKGMGIRPGIWVRYLINGKDDEERKMKDLPESWYLERNNRVLDPSNPEVLEYVKKTTEDIISWGYELIKHDFSTFDIFGKWGFEIPREIAIGNWGFYDNTKTTAEIIKNFYKVIKDSSNGAVIIGCNCIGHLCAGYHQLNRTGDDTSGLEWQRTCTMGVNTLAFRCAQHNAFFGADADCVGIMGLIDWKLNKQWLKILSSSGTPLFISCKPGVLKPSEEEDVKEAYMRASVQKDELVPLDWMETTCPTTYLINGEITKFDWYPEKGNETFNPMAL